MANRAEWEVKALPMSTPTFELTPIAVHFAISRDTKRLWELADEIDSLVTAFNAEEWKRQQEE